MVYVGDYNI